MYYCVKGGRIGKRLMDQVYEHIAALFPLGYKDKQFTTFIDSFRSVLDDLVQGQDSPRIFGTADKDTYNRLTNK